MTLLFGFAAVNTGNNLLYLLVSALLGFMAVSGFLGQHNLQSVALTIPATGEFYAGLPGVLRFRLANRRRLPVFLLTVSVGDEQQLFPVLSPGERRDGHLHVTLPRRGYQPLPPVLLSSPFPVNFFVRSRQLDPSRDCLVFPRPRPVPWPYGAGNDSGPARVELLGRGQDGELRGIVGYRAGDPLKMIHWKLSARQPELQVKQLGRQGTSSIMLIPDEWPGPLDIRLGRAAYLLERALSKHCAVGLRLGDRTIAPAFGSRHRHRLLKELAVYGLQD